MRSDVKKKIHGSLWSLLSVSCLPGSRRHDDSPPDNIKRFSKPLSHMVVAAWLAILSSSSYKIMIFPDAFFCVTVKDFKTRNGHEYKKNLEMTEIIDHTKTVWPFSVEPWGPINIFYMIYLLFMYEIKFFTPSFIWPSY